MESHGNGNSAAAVRRTSITGQEKGRKVVSRYPILQRIGKHLDINDLLRLRITCVEWNRAFVTLLDMNSRSFQLVSRNPNGQDKQFRTKHKVISYACDTAVAGDVRSEIFGCFPNLETLVLGLILSYTEINKRMDDQLPVPRPGPEEHRLSTFEKLRHLNLGLVCRRWGEGSSVHWLVLDILNNAPGLTTLFVSDLALQTLRSVQPQNLQELQIESRLTVRMIEALLEMNEKCHPDRLKLVKLKITVIEPYPELSELLSHFLAQQATTLRELQIRTDGGNNLQDSILRFPHMEVLEFLELEPYSFLRDMHVQLESKRMDLNFPKLNRLVYSTNESHKFLLDAESPLASFHNITDLSLSYLEDSEVRRIAEGFPSLLRLHLETHYKLPEESEIWLNQIEFVCNTWPQLEALHISGRCWHWPQPPADPDYIYAAPDPGPPPEGFKPPNLDELFTGVPREFYKHSISVEQLNLGSILRGAPIDVEKLRSFQHRKGLADLTELREFSFDPPGYLGPRMLLIEVWDHNKAAATDVTGYFCFTRPDSKLQRIRVTSNGVRWTPTCGAAIRRSLGLAAVLDIPQEQKNYMYYLLKDVINN